MQFSRLKSIFTAFCLLLVVSGIAAQDTVQQPKTIDLKLIEYIEERFHEESGFKKRVIDSGIVNSSGHEDLGSVLQDHSGMHVRTYGLGGLASPSFRGTNASHTQVNWNGVPLNAPTNGQVDLALFPMAVVDEVELMYGANSLHNRSGGVGGSINLNNQPDWTPRTGGKVRQGIGSFNNYQTFGQFTHVRDQVYSQSNVYFRDAQNNFTYKDVTVAGQPEKEQDHAAFKQYGAMQELHYRASDKDVISFNGWYQRTEREIMPSLTTPNADQEQFNSDLRSVVSWKHQLDDGQYQVRSAYLDQDLRYVDHVQDLDALHRTRSFLNEFNLRHEVGEKGMMGAGYSLDHHQARSENFEGVAEQTRHSLYLKYARRFTEWLKGQGLLRQEAVDGALTPLLPALGVKIRPFPKGPLTVSGNVYRNYKIPTLNDLYWEPGGNPDLKPETGWGKEASIELRFEEFDWALSSLEFGVTGYSARYENWIQWAQYEGQTYWSPRNVDQVLTQGLEVSGSGKLELGKYLVDLGGHYSYTASKNMPNDVSGFDASEGRQLIYIPYHKGGGRIAVNREGYRLGYSHGYTGFRYTARDHSEHLDPFQVGSVTLGKSFRWNGVEARMNVNVENVWDVDYQMQAWRPMPGRSYFLTIELGYHKKPNQ